MVTILEISPVRSLFCLLLDSGEKIWLRKADMQSFPFSAGAEIDEKEFYQFVTLCQYPRALNQAVAMLARRACSTGEIRHKLVSGRYIPDVADLVLYKLEKEKLVNDRDFCEQWIRYRMDCRYGPRRILQELKAKGIPEDMAEEVLASFDPESSDNSAAALALKSWKRVKPGEDRRKSRQKVIASLVRRGFDWDTARSASDAAEKQLEIE